MPRSEGGSVGVDGPVLQAPHPTGGSVQVEDSPDSGWLVSGVLLQSGAGSAQVLPTVGIPNPVALAPQTPAKALATITASAFRRPKANTLPWPLRSACIASMRCSVL